MINPRSLRIKMNSLFGMISWVIIDLLWCKKEVEKLMWTPT